MENERSYILALNSGSSSVKFCVYALADPLEITITGKIEKIGTGESIFSSNLHSSGPEAIALQDMQQAAGYLMNWLKKQIDFAKIRAAGHRIVHGMDHQKPELITGPLLENLRKISEIDPDHMPGALALVEKIVSEYPDLTQVACFDTAFHADLPMEAKTFPIPRKLALEGIRRYGFHGLSYSYLLEKLKETVSEELAGGRLLLAHLGSGASMAAVNQFRSMDTTMGFTPVGGLMMGTRSGDLDPGLIPYLMQKQHLDADQVSELINKKSGLLGVSETSADMQELMKIEKTDARAAEAIALFCYQAKKTLCAYAGVLGGLDAIVFTGGIGEHIPEVRTRICAGLQYLGIELDNGKNLKNDFKISVENKIPVYVIPTDEAYMIARYTVEILNHHNSSTT